MRTCEEYELLISAFIDGELAEGERAELMDHMALCPVCQRYFDDQIALHDALSGLEDVPAPAELAGRVMERVRSTPQDRPIQKKVRPLPRWGRWAALAACCALVVLGVWRLLGPDARFTSQSAVSSCAADEAAQDTAAPAEHVERSAPESAREAADGERPAVAADSAAPQEESLPAPAALAPEAAEDCKPYAESAKIAEGAAVLSTASPVAAGWVEEHLSLAWTAGAVYPLTEEEYAGLREALEAAGAAFDEAPGEGGGWVLLAE